MAYFYITLAASIIDHLSFNEIFLSSHIMYHMYIILFNEYIYFHAALFIAYCLF